MQELLDGLYLVANRLAQKVKRLKVALSDLDEVKKSADAWTEEERASFEKAVKGHTILLKAMIAEVEEEIEIAKKKLWAAGTPEQGVPHYAEMAVTGEEG